MRFHKRLIGLIIFLPCFAVADMNFSGPQISVYGGFTNTKISPSNLQFFGETDSLVPSPNQKHQTDFNWGFGAAYRWVMPQYPQFNLLHDVSLGLDFYYFFSKQHGEVWQFQQSMFNNYMYQLPIHSARLLVDTEWTLHPIGTRLFPFIEGGIGFAANTINYSNAPLPGITGGFWLNSSNTQYQFSYTVGLGAKFLIIPQMTLSIRYLYADLGYAVTGTAGTAPLINPISVPLTTQAGLIGLTYLF